jgi:hypothetical protein
VLGQWSILIGVASVMVRRSVFDAVGLFDESLKTAEDLDMWWRIARQFEYHVIEEPLVRVRRQAVSMSSDKSKASDGFRIILEKAFTRDAALTVAQKRHYLSNMYAQTALNLVGDGAGPQMSRVRQDAGRSLALWPLQPNALAAWLFSLLPAGLRRSVISVVRRTRFQSAKPESI